LLLSIQTIEPDPVRISLLPPLIDFHMRSLLGRMNCSRYLESCWMHGRLAMVPRDCSSKYGQQLTCKRAQHIINSTLRIPPTTHTTNIRVFSSSKNYSCSIQREHA
jgi:hypothetical protein